MFIEEGYVYHVKNEFFEIINDKNLMKNHEGENSRPNYFCLRTGDSDIVWFIPMSSKVEKYRRIQEYKIKKYNNCDTIVIGNYRGRENVFLIQNMFPIIERFIDHIDTVEGKAIKVPSETRREISKKVKKVFRLKENGINLIFPDIDSIIRQLKGL